MLGDKTKTTAVPEGHWMPVQRRPQQSLRRTLTFALCRTLSHINLNINSQTSYSGVGKRNILADTV